VANAIFTAFLNGQLGKGTYTAIDFEASTDLKLALCDHAGAEGAPDTANDDFYDDIDGSCWGTRSTALSSLTVGTVAVGVVDAADLAPAWTSVTGGTTYESIMLIKDTGTASTSPLICYWDDDSGTVLPLTSNGGDINVSFSASGIFKI
jgi:hypothetical protein